MVHLANKTLFESNSAPSNLGGAIQLVDGTLEYTLPAPPGRYLFITKGDTFSLEPGAVDTDFPLSCPAGVVGGTSEREQSGPQCAMPW